MSGRSVEESRQRRDQCRSVERLAFPHHQHFPTERPQRRDVPLVPLHVLLELLVPVGRACLRCRRSAAARVPMPEASMHEDHFSQAGKGQIRRARPGCGDGGESGTLKRAPLRERLAPAWCPSRGLDASGPTALRQSAHRRGAGPHSPHASLRMRNMPERRVPRDVEFQSELSPWNPPLSPSTPRCCASWANG